MLLHRDEEQLCSQYVIYCAIAMLTVLYWLKYLNRLKGKRNFINEDHLNSPRKSRRSTLVSGCQAASQNKEKRNYRKQKHKYKEDENEANIDYEDDQEYIENY